MRVREHEWDLREVPWADPGTRLSVTDGLVGRGVEKGPGSRDVAFNANPTRNTRWGGPSTTDGKRKDGSVVVGRAYLACSRYW
jgi:hypothetical protein